MDIRSQPGASHRGTGLRGLAMRRPLKEAGVLLVVTMAATALGWALRPDRLPLRADPAFYELELEAPLIDPDPALALYQAGEHLFIDTRPVPEDSLATIPGALPIRPGSFDDDLLDLFDFLSPEDPLILFGDGNLLPVSNIASRLKERGYRDIRILRGGIGAWVAAGGPVTRPESGKEGS